MYPPNKTLEWLRFVLNSDSEKPEIGDWQEVYDFARKQSIIGICDPTGHDIRMPQNLLFQWIGDVQAIRVQNKLLNQRSAEVYHFLRESGFRCCVLKGQGNALMYPDPSLRCPGDVDVWVDADQNKVYDFVKERYPDAEECIKHIKLPIFMDVEVDVHHTPLRFLHIGHNRYLQKWLSEQIDEQMSHYTTLPDTRCKIAVPTAKFNAVYQLGHIMVHLFDEGLGFRQLIDYFYVLKEVCSMSQKERDDIVDTWKRLGMLKLASAVMWVESEVLGIDKRCILTAPNEQLGKRLLADVLEGGNFGHYSARRLYISNGNRFTKRVSTLRRLVRMSPCFPGEATYRIPHRFLGLSKVYWRKFVVRK